jgi:Domain of unknown function (DU1801)
MAELHSSARAEPVAALLDRITPPQRQVDALRLIAIFREVTGFRPVVWKGGMIGFGRYAYTYASGQRGEYFATGFAPRKAECVVYILPGYSDFTSILQDLGPHRKGKSCLYLGDLRQISEPALRRLIRAGLDDLARHWPVFPA